MILVFYTYFPLYRGVEKIKWKGVNDLLKIVCLSIIVFIALIQDIKTYKIKNITIIVGLLMGGLFLIFEKDLQTILMYLCGMGLPILILMPLFILRMFGAGDIKLFSVIGLFLGPQMVLKVIVVSFFLGAALSCFKLFKNRNIKQRANYFIQYIKGVSYCRELEYYDAKGDNYKNAIHFSIPIFAALCVQLILLGGAK